MGCDIHGTVEVFDGEHWVMKDLVVNPEQRKEYGEWGGTLFSGRNYSLFAVLAGVRNGSRVMETGICYTPIAEPRGIPDDSPFQLEANEYGVDGHSHSYVTLKELQEYDWDQEIPITRMVTAEDAKAFREQGVKPTSWCGWTSDPTAVKLTWPTTPREQVGRWVDIALEHLAKLSDNPEHVRLVFFFDN